MILEKVYQKVRIGTANSQRRHSHKDEAAISSKTGSLPNNHL